MGMSEELRKTSKTCENCEKLRNCGKLRKIAKTCGPPPPAVAPPPPNHSRLLLHFANAKVCVGVRSAGHEPGMNLRGSGPRGPCTPGFAALRLVCNGPEHASTSRLIIAEPSDRLCSLPFFLPLGSPVCLACSDSRPQECKRACWLLSWCLITKHGSTDHTSDPIVQ